MRETPERTATDEDVYGVLHASDTLRLEAILPPGVPTGHSLDSLPWKKVHWESL